MDVIFVKLNSVEEIAAILQKVKPSGKAAAVIVRPEFGACPKFLQYALLQAYKSFQDGTQNAKSVELEALSKLALTKNVASALDFTKPTGKDACVLLDGVVGKLPKEIETWTPTKQQLQAWQKWLVEKYGITISALANFQLEDLLIETVAVENI